jgi:Uncharacterised protein family (UPF0236)
VGCRGYSLPLQRRITDFGADVPFGKVPGKMREHYGISIPSASVRCITEKHAEKVRSGEVPVGEIPGTDGAEYIISETDGTMIPIADTDGKESDRRKNRRCRWKEARLTLSHPKGSVTSVFGCTLGSPDEAGNMMLSCAVRSGMGRKTRVHCVGDGAPWVREQAERVFGEQGSFLIDFYHLCKYLSEASEVCSRRDSETFFNAQKQFAEKGRITEIIRQMKPHTEPASVSDNNAPVRRCIRYITNRAGQFGYKEAVENGLPIGSGEIESAHRYIIQKRLKISGAWWAENNAQNMLSLRVLRANGDWENYWRKS